MSNNLLFQPESRPRVLKTNIKGITEYVIKRITETGYNVYLDYSNKSRSRYLEIELSETRKIIVRISDHPADRKNRWRYKFDIYTETLRPGAVDYIEFIDALKLIAGHKRQKAVCNKLPGDVSGDKEG